MSETGEIAVRGIIMAEDITRSLGNSRHSFINIYSGVHIVRGSFPVFFQTGVGILFCAKKTGRVPIRLEFAGSVLDNIPGGTTGEINVIHMPSDQETHLLVCGVTHMQIARPGNLEIRFGMHGHTPKTERIYRFKHKPGSSDVWDVTGASATASSLTSSLTNMPDD